MANTLRDATDADQEAIQLTKEERKGLRTMGQPIDGNGSLEKEGFVLTLIQCITRDDLVPKVAPECQFVQTIEGATAQFKIFCPIFLEFQEDEAQYLQNINPNDQILKKKGEVSYSGNSMQGSMMTIMIKPNGKKDTLTTDIKGEYLGQCDK